MRTTTLICAVTLCAVTSAIAAEPTGFFRKYCFDCHDNAGKTAGLSLEALAPSYAHDALHETWIRIHDRVRDGEMPPEGEPAAEEAGGEQPAGGAEAIAADQAPEGAGTEGAEEGAAEGGEAAAEEDDGEAHTPGAEEDEEGATEPAPEVDIAQQARLKAVESAGDGAMERGGYLEAVAYYEAALRIEPTSERVAEKLKRARGEVDRIKREEELRKAKRRARPPARARKAKDTARKVRKPKAAPAAAALTPEETKAAVKTALRDGMSSFKGGDYKGALKAFQKAQKLDPNNVLVRKWVKMAQDKL